MKQHILKVRSRTEIGRGPVRRLRKAGSIPAVVYGPSGNRNISLTLSDFRDFRRKIGDSTALVEVHEEGSNPVLSVIQDLQRDPRTDTFQHIDFLEVNADEKMSTSVPLHVSGESFGEKNEGGFQDILTHEVDVRCLPKDLPEFISIDVSHLHVGQSIHIGDLPELDGVEYTGDPELSVVIIGGHMEDEVEPVVEVEEGAESTEEGEEESTEEEE